MPWVPSARTAPRRGLGTTDRLKQPEALTVALLGTLALVAVARGPITHWLGTADDAAGYTTPPLAAVTAPAVSGPMAHASLAAAVPLPRTHAATDPFSAGVAGRSVAKPAAKPAGHAASPSAGQPASHPAAPPVTPASAAAGCASSYVVQPGDTLWSIAQAKVGTTSVAATNAAWHRIYTRNQAKVGADPSVLNAGITLCLPQH
jgi:nucleoid-associated protein YgaU